MTKHATAADLTRAPATVKTEDVELANGLTVTVRGLTRRELMTGGEGGKSTAEIEVFNVATALIKPTMTESQVRTWQANADTIRDFAKVTIAIRDLSGLGEGAAKSDVAEARD